MTAYEIADAERKQFWDRKMLVKEQMQSVTDPAELERQKKRYSILDAMYQDALERMEAARPASQKKRKAPKTRCISYNACGRDGKSFDWLERNHVTFSDLEGNQMRWEDLGVEEGSQKERFFRAIKRGHAACSPRQQEMLDLMLQGKSVCEIAETTGVDRSTVSRTLTRAKRTIRKMENAMARSEKTAAAGAIDVSRREVAEHILSVLTETQAVYVYLYYGEWLSMQGIADLLGKDKATVCRTIHRACQRIRDDYNCAESGALLGVDTLEPMLYEIYQSHAADAIIPQRALEAAKRIQHRDTARAKSYSNARNRRIFASAMWTHPKTRQEDGSRLLRALRESAAQRAGSMLEWLCALLRYAKDKVLRSVDTYYEWQRQH